MPLGFPYYLSGLWGEGLLRIYSIVPPPHPTTTTTPELLSPSTIKLENVSGLFVVSICCIRIFPVLLSSPRMQAVWPQQHVLSQVLL